MDEWQCAIPAMPVQDWRARMGARGKIIFGKKRVDRLLSRWHPFSDLYIASPGSDEFLPAININELREQLYSSFVRRCKISILILCFSVIALTLIAEIKRRANANSLAIALSLLILFILFEYHLSSRSSVTLADRSNFYLGLRQHSFLDAILWAAVMVVAGTTQLYFERDSGFEGVILKYGFFYKSVSNGEWWRLVTGPFIHSGLGHWAANLAFLFTIVGFGSTISRRATFFTFLLSSILGACAGWLFSIYAHQDAYVGISAGIFGIFGMCAGTAFRNSTLFPARMGMTVLNFAVLNIAIAALINPSSSSEGHIAGLITGLVCGNIIPYARKMHRTNR